MHPEVIAHLQEIEVFPEVEETENNKREKETTNNDFEAEVYSFTEADYQLLMADTIPCSSDNIDKHDQVSYSFI